MDASNTALDPASFRSVSSVTTTAAGPTNQLGRNEFMKLLVAQLSHQDPLEPTKDQEFVAQLATFSSLEQLIDLNKRMDGVISGQDQLVNSQALNMIGKQVLADTHGKFRLGEHGAQDIVFELPEAMQGVRIEVTDAAGKKVKTLVADGSVGRHTVKWDGTDDGGKALAPGDYHFKIVGLNGDKETPLNGFTRIPIDGVRFGPEGLSLVSGDQTISFADIAEIGATN